MKGGAWWAQKGAAAPAAAQVGGWKPGVKGGKPAAAPSAPAPSEFKVNTKVANVNGTYKLSGNNHNRGIYQMYEGELKDAELKEMPVIYYWDERDGAAAQGWWIGIGVGGAQVWARHPSSAQTPPESGWHIPYNGAVCQQARVTPLKPAGAAPTAPPTPGGVGMSPAGVKRPAALDPSAQGAFKKPAVGEAYGGGGYGGGYAQDNPQNAERVRG